MQEHLITIGIGVIQPLLVYAVNRAVRTLRDINNKLSELGTDVREFRVRLGSHEEVNNERHKENLIEIRRVRDRLERLERGDDVTP